MGKQPLTDERREELQQHLANLDEAENEIFKAQEPFRKAMAAKNLPTNFDLTNEDLNLWTK
jgi:hypothetical protein